MGINRVFGKVKSYVKNFVGQKTTDNIKKVAQSLTIKPQYCAASIGSVLNNLIGNDEIGDKLELTTKKENMTISEMPHTNPEYEQVDNDSIQAESSTTSSKTAITSTSHVTTKSNNKVQKKKNEIKKISQEELKNLKVELKEKCINSKINYAKLVILLAAITGTKSADFEKQDNNIQYALIKYVMQSIDKVNEKNLPNVNKLDAVITDAALMYHFITHDENGKTVEITEFSLDELKEKRQELDIKLRKRREEKEAEIENLPEEQRAAAREALKDELAGYRKHIYEELQKKIPFECAIEGLLILSLKDLGNAAKELMDMYPIEIRKQIANTMHSMDTLKEYIKSVEGRGEKLDDKTAEKAFREFHKIFGTYKTIENLELDEQQLQEARKNGDMPQNLIKASEMGIGEAAYANINMTAEEKDAFIQNWINNNEGFLSDADLAEVETSAKEYIENLLDKNPELKDNFQTVKRSIKEIVEKTLNRVFEEKKSNNKSIVEVSNELKRIINAPSGKVHNLNKEVLSLTQQYIRIQAAKFETPAIKKSTEQVEIALLKGIITEDQAIKNLDNSEHKFIKMCIQNSKLASKYNERINLYIKSETDVEKLKDIAAIAPHDIVLKIVQNMRGDKNKLTQELIKKHEVDYNTKVILTKYTEEHAA